MTDAPAPNRIHSLPVLVRYHLPSSSQSFTALFPSPQQVYVHPNPAGSSSGGDDESWGSIYLKTVVQGVLLASPELYPSHSSTTDLSLYILDPRETFLRKSRASSPFPTHLRPSHTSASSPLSNPSSPSINPNTTGGSTTTEVWTGKGLVSWALDEPGVGKNLITGRLIKSRTFSNVTQEIKGLSPLEALMRMCNAEEQDSWGIEISLGLRSGTGSAPPPGAGPHAQNVNVEVRSIEDGGFRRPSLVSTVSEPPAPAHRVEVSNSVPHPPKPSLQHRAPTQPLPSSSSTSVRPLSPSRIVTSTPHTKARDLRKHSTGKKKKCTNESHSHSHSSHPHPHPYPLPHPHGHSRTAPRPGVSRKVSSSSIRSSSKKSASSDVESFPDDVPATLYKDPESLTKEQAERLLESPAFLSMLSKLTGQPIQSSGGHPNTKRTREEETMDASKRQRMSSLSAPTPRRGSVSSTVAEVKTEEPAPAFKCWNCGRTKSAVWRMKVMDDGKSVRVCNACGLYWNKMRAMRPPTLWEGVDDDVRTKPKKDEPEEKPASRIDSGNQQSHPRPPVPASSSPVPGGGFKRTLSVVVNQDAKRIAAMKMHTKPQPPQSTLRQSFKPAPMTSPPRASTSASKSVRNARWHNDSTAAASSPGGWLEPMHPPPAQPASDNFNPVPPSSPKRTSRPATIPEESPNTAIRRILGTDMAMQSLDMPLSDDGHGHMSMGSSATAFDWNTDLSAFFDVEGFSLSAHPTTTEGQHGVEKHDNDNSNMRPRYDHSHSDGTTEGEDDVLSQLFNRTSSAMLESSPAPFDFSQLPPSSPPLSVSDHLPHSALLLSSPDLSPMDRKYSPTKSVGAKSTPASTMTPMPIMEKSPLGNGGYMDTAALEELWRMTEQTHNHAMSSAAETEHLVGGGRHGQGHGHGGSPTPEDLSGEDIFAFLEKNFTQV